MRIHRRDAGRLRAAVVAIPGLRSAVALLALEAGQWFEPRGRAGVARLTAQSLLRGTTSRDAGGWAAALDALGANARLDVGSHAAVMSGQCLAGDLPAYLGLVADAVLRPAFASAEVELVRAQSLAALEEDAKDTRAVAERTWRELAYPPEYPFRSRALGEERVVREANVDELRRFHRDAIAGGRAVLVIAGGVEPAAALDAAIDAFVPLAAIAADGPRGGNGEFPAIALAAPQRRVEVVPDKTQCDVVLGWLGLPRPDPRFVAARVTNMVFAADPFASRAGNVVRDQLGLAYYFFSTIAGTRGQGPWTVRMGVNPRNVERAIETTFIELRKVLAGQIADDDLALAQDKLVGELEVARESPAGIAQMVLEGEMFGLGDDHLERYPGMLRAVTKEQVVEIANAFLPAERYALAIAGPPPEA